MLVKCFTGMVDDPDTEDAAEAFAEAARNMGAGED